MTHEFEELPPLRVPAWGGLEIDDWESGKVQKLLEDLGEVMAERGVPSSPLIVLRALDIVMSHVIVGRLERQLSGSPAPGDAAAAAGAAGKGPAVHPAFEALGKARERLRKAIKEFEEALAACGRPLNPGLAELRSEVVQAGRGVAEAAVEDMAGETAQDAAEDRETE